MNLTLTMRRFSIRFRMVSAIVVVLLLLTSVGASGLWGMYRSNAHSEMFMTQVFEQRVGLDRLRLALAETSQFEKDMVIQYESPEQMSLANLRWEKARTQAQQPTHQ